MNPDLERLIQLQRAESELRRVETELAEVPRQRAAMEAALEAERARLETARQDLGGGQKARRQHEGELQDLEAKRSRLKGQLMDVKTNKEYTAMLHEIETVKAERGTLETRILQSMESADGLEHSIRAKETALAEEQKRVEAGLAALREEEKAVSTEKARLEEDRRRLEGEIPPDLVAEFFRILKGRGGLAVVRVVAGLCRGCSVRIQPRVFQLVRRNEVLLRCDSCKRFLYYLEEKSADPPPGP